MPPLAQRNELVASINDRYLDLLQTDWSTLSRKDSLGEYHLEAAVGNVERAMALIRKLESLKMTSTMSFHALERLSEAINAIGRSRGMIRAFSLDIGNIKEQHAAILVSASDSYDTTFEATKDLIAFGLAQLAAQSTSTVDGLKSDLLGTVDGRLRTAEASIAAGVAQVQELAEKAEKTRIAAEASSITASETLATANDSAHKAKSAADSIMSQAADLGVSTNAKHFSDAYTSHAWAAKLWLGATIACAAATLCVAVYIFWLASTRIPSSVAEAVNLSVSKVILLSVLSAGVIFSSRNFRSHKHNQTLNKHRQNALATFKTFVEGTSDARVKDAILLHAAQSVFGPRSTGYDTSDASPSEISPIVDVLSKSITSATSSSK